MFKSFQDTSALQQFHGFPNLNMQQATSAYGFSGVTFWLDAAYGLNTQTNLGAVSRWQARVGGAIFEQATAGNQPRLILTDANYNNLPSVENTNFVTGNMLTSQGTGLKYNGNNTIVVISKINSANSINGIIGLNQTGTNGLVDGGTTTNFNGFGLYLGATPILQGSTETATARIKIITNTNVIVNGIIESTGINSTNAYDFVTLFRPGSSASTSMVGTIAEIIAFGYSMTSDEAIALSNNINQKYAIY